MIAENRNEHTSQAGSNGKTHLRARTGMPAWESPGSGDAARDRAGDEGKRAEGALVAERGALVEERYDETRLRADAHGHQHTRPVVLVGTRGEANRVEDVAFSEQLPFHASTKRLGAKGVEMWDGSQVLLHHEQRKDSFWQVHKTGEEFERTNPTLNCQFQLDGYGSGVATTGFSKFTPSCSSLNLSASSGE